MLYTDAFMHEIIRRVKNMIIYFDNPYIESIILYLHIVKARSRSKWVVIIVDCKHAT